ncbi:MAG: PIN domain-containing protein [Protaetiibacter sp.]
MTLRLLVDNSVIQRLAQPAVYLAWQRLLERGDIATCLPTLLEAGYSARSASAHGALLELEQHAKIMLLPAPEIAHIAIDIQSALFAAGKGRAAGVSDLQIAATAIHHSTPADPVIVVHYDADFDHMASAEPRLRAEWVVPRTTAD